MNITELLEAIESKVKEQEAKAEKKIQDQEEELKKLRVEVWELKAALTKQEQETDKWKRVAFEAVNSKG